MLPPCSSMTPRCCSVTPIQFRQVRVRGLALLLLFVFGILLLRLQLLHYDEILALDKGKLLKNPKEPPRARKRFLEKKLSELMGGYNKENLDFEKLLDKVECAIENEKHFCEDVTALKNELGTNVGLLLKELMGTF